jgi:hypothetical protein
LAGADIYPADRANHPELANEPTIVIVTHKEEQAARVSSPHLGLCQWPFRLTADGQADD